MNAFRSPAFHILNVQSAMKDYRPSIALSSQMVLKLRKASQHLLLPQDSAQHSTESFKTYDAGTWRLKALEKSFFSRLCSLFSRLCRLESECTPHTHPHVSSADTQLYPCPWLVSIAEIGLQARLSSAEPVLLVLRNSDRHSTKSLKTLKAHNWR